MYIQCTFEEVYGFKAYADFEPPTLRTSMYTNMILPIMGLPPFDLEWAHLPYDVWNGMGK